MRLDRYLFSLSSQLPHSFWLKAIKNGDVKLNDAKTKFNIRLVAGDNLQFSSWLQAKIAQNSSVNKALNVNNKQVQAYLAQIEAAIIAEHNDFIVLNKPAGIACQGGISIKMALDNLLTAYYSNTEYQPRLVHRLDQETSGILLMAKNLGAAQQLTKMFAERSIQKTYLAKTNNKPIKGGMIKLNMAKTSKGLVIVVNKNLQPGNYTLTSTHVKVIKSSHNSCLLELKPITGFKHQLRVLLQHLQAPIIGDSKYGTANKSAKQSLMLHAHKISFNYNGELHKYIAQPPDYWDYSTLH